MWLLPTLADACTPNFFRVTWDDGDCQTPVLEGFGEGGRAVVRARFCDEAVVEFLPPPSVTISPRGTVTPETARAIGEVVLRLEQAQREGTLPRTPMWLK